MLEPVPKELVGPLCLALPFSSLAGTSAPQMVPGKLLPGVLL